MRSLLAATALAMFAAAPVMAASPAFTLDFEKNWDFLNGDVNAYYGGGSAADGTSGPDLGVSFAGVSGLSNDASFTYFTNAPSLQGVAYAHTFAAGDNAFMNVAAGVDSALAFYYSSPSTIAGAVKAYSGLNGTGSLLGTLDLAANAGDTYNVWTPVRFLFNGTARSFDLTGTANLAALDNISVSAVPEPSTMLLMLCGGVAVLRTTHRRRT